MKRRVRQFAGFTLIELLVVMVIVALLVAVAIPSARALRGSCESTGAQSMISSAFSSARAMAAQKHCYAGVRFQKIYEPNTVSIIDRPQYMVFIVYDTQIPNGQVGNLGCRAVEGIKPIKLPDNVGVIEAIPNDVNYLDAELGNRTTFSILFSPTGKLIIHSLWVRNKDGVLDSDNSSTDEVFNNSANVTANKPVGMFMQDLKSEIESSMKEFIIYDKTKLKAADPVWRWRDYLSKLPVVYINQYTGTMIEK